MQLNSIFFFVENGQYNLYQNQENYVKDKYKLSPQRFYNLFLHSVFFVTITRKSEINAPSASQDLISHCLSLPYLFF